MNPRKLSCIIATILSAAAANRAHAEEPANSSSLALEEVVVTAQRRSEDLQTVPISLQVLTGDDLGKLSVQTFDDFVKYLPNVSFSSNGPGQSNVFMRGLSGGSSPTQSSGSQGSFPNVAIYLDDQSGSLPGRNLDVYAADLERIEVLEGPQGTLFGAGAQAGVIRYITNKPKFNKFEAAFNAGYGTTAHGEDNSNVDATLNLPLIDDKLAVRAVVYSESRGGYIDNVASTFTRRLTDAGVQRGYDGGAVALGNFPIVNNYHLVADDINPVTYKGLRVSAKYQINDNWDVLVAQSYQDMHAQGAFYQLPKGVEDQPLPELSVTLFSPLSSRDKFNNTAVTVNGKIGEIQAVYTGAYMKRSIDQVGDYTSYTRGVYSNYYQCHGSDGGTLTPTCYSPVATWHELEDATHQSHEIRLSTPDDWRLRGIVGAFYEDFNIEDRMNWNYRSLPACTTTLTTGCMTNVAPTPGSTAIDPNIRSDVTAFFYDAQRGYKQSALFASVDFDIFPQLTLTAGTRYYRFDEDMIGSVLSSFGCYEAGPAPCGGAAGHGTNLDAANLQKTYSGFKSRVSLSWDITPDALLYYTWSQGFRPGGFNKPGSGCKVPSTDAPNGQFCIPLFFNSDNLTNNEIGWKTTFLDRRLQFNGAIYQEDYKEVQTNFFAPEVTGNLSFATTGPTYRIRGIETSIDARVTQGLTVSAAASWNSSKLTESPGLPFNNPEYSGQPGYGEDIPGLENLYGPVGSPGPYSPKFQGNIRARYDWTFGNTNAFVQFGATHTTESFTQPANQPAGAATTVTTSLARFEVPAYSTYNASIGVSRDQWDAALVIQNLTDENAATFISTSSFIEAETVLRPRTITLSIGYRY